MGRLRDGIFIIAFSLFFLSIYLNGDRILDRLDDNIMDVQVRAMEEIDDLCQGKEDAFMEPEITLSGGKLGYDRDQNMLLIPQSMSKSRFEGSLKASDGKLYFLEDEGLADKAGALRENKLFHLFWVRDTQCWMYNVYFTGMPVASITSHEGLEEEEIKRGEIWVYDPYHSAAGYQETACSWHLRGASSLQYEKSSYRLTLTDNKLSFLGMRKDDDWMLHALYDDDGLIHNKLSYDVWREIAADNHVDHDEGIHMEYLELFMDDQYMGVYGLSERVDKKALELGKNDILYKCRSQKNPDEDDFYEILTEDMNPTFVWKYPKDFEMEDWEPLKDWVSLFCFGKSDDYELCRAMVNLNNAIDYNLFNMLTCGMDNMMKNIYFWADYQSDGSYQFIKIPWDLNMTWGNSWIDDYNCNFNKFQEKNFQEFNCWTPDVYKLYECNPEEMGSLLRHRWQDLRSRVITREALYAKAEGIFAYLHDSGAYTRNLVRWPPKEDCWKDEYIYEYIDKRMEFLDSYIEQMR